MKIYEVLSAKFNTILARFLGGAASIDATIPGYTLLRDLTPSYTSRKNRVGLYTDRHGEKVVIKRVIFWLKTLDALYARNEAFILQKIAKVAESNSPAPEFVELIAQRNQVGFVTKFFEGVNVEKLSPALRGEVAIATYTKLRELSEKLAKHNFYSLPVRLPIYYFVSFGLNLIRLLTKDASKSSSYLKYAFQFYRNYMGVLFGAYTLGFVHRDLYADNLLYAEKTKTVKITDWESSIVSDSLYDLSQIAMIYCKDIGVQGVIDLVIENTSTNSERRRFIGLGIFNAMQILSNTSKSHPVYRETQEFLDTLMKLIAPGIIYKKTPFEIVNGMVMNAIYHFYHVTGISSISTGKKLMLCYHSVANTNWKYSSRISNFANQIVFLKKHYSLVSIDTLLRPKTHGVSISFDDGYLDVLTNAFPILQKNNCPATLFALSDPAHARHGELDNTYTLLTDGQLQTFAASGWTIGSHTRTHANLGKCTDKQLTEEIITSKRELEKKLMIPIQHIAYPKGIYSRKIQEYAKQAGYTAGWTTDGTEVFIDSDWSGLGRISIDGEISIKQFEALLSPLGLRVTKVFTYLLYCKAKYLDNYL